MAPKGSTGGLFSLPEPGVPSVSNVPFPLKSRGGTRTRPNCRAQNSTDQKHHFGWGHQRSCSRATRHAAQADENASLATSPIRLVARGGQGNLTDLAQELPFSHRVLCASTATCGSTTSMSGIVRSRPLWLRVCPYFPFNARICLNGHNWLAQRMRNAGIQFRQEDNAFLTCSDPPAL